MEFISRHDLERFVIDNEEWEYLALRTQDEPFKVGETMYHDSTHTIDGEDQYELDGVCATKLMDHSEWLNEDDVLKDMRDAFAMHGLYGERGRHGTYVGKHTALLACDYASGGFDHNEIVMREPVVLAVVATD